jgi:hypothetical protein
MNGYGILFSENKVRYGVWQSGQFVKLLDKDTFYLLTVKKEIKSQSD